MVGVLEPSDLGWTEIRHFARRFDAEQHALVLIAMSISCLLIRRPWGIGLLVPVREAHRAEEELTAYTTENEPQPAATTPFTLSRIFDGTLIAAALIVLVQMAAERGWFGADWYQAGAANAGLIAGGEWWRAFTALGLHGDLGHLLSNVVFGGVLGLVVSTTLGAGLGWLSIVLSGGIGNLVASAFRSAEHTSIGASTAVFGALAIVAALAWQRQTVTGPGLRRWAPLGAALMLLVFMGVGGERTDIGAHFAGFAVGGIFGFLLHQLSGWIPKGWRAQLAYGGTAAALFLVPWLVAL
jgi:rhomboid protease GluP